MAKIYILQRHPVRFAKIADSLEGTALAWRYVRLDKGQAVSSEHDTRIKKLSR